MSHAIPILIAGPTASGKSALALAIAEHLDGIIINADSMQVYTELRILTARPSVPDEAKVPHRLYGHVPARDAYSAGRFVADVRAALAEAASLGRRPVIVGGTGLYFKALLEGLSPIPPVGAEVRAFWRREAERLGAAALHEILATRDAEMAARLEPSDTQRIVRALEVLDSSGRSLALWQSQPGEALLNDAACKKLLVLPDRAVLHARADARFDAMMAAGALDEVRALARLDLSSDLPAMRALGVAPLIAALRGEMPIADAVMTAKAQTRQYIKRQETWIGRNMIAWENIKTQQMESNKSEIIAFIQR
jgi:tRNA dimethylallyltransferase